MKLQIQEGMVLPFAWTLCDVSSASTISFSETTSRSRSDRGFVISAVRWQ
jgi:hypothetical protein